mgnify:CR=1 FL=1
MINPEIFKSELLISLIQGVVSLTIIIFIVALIRYFTFRKKVFELLQQRAAEAHQSYQTLQQEKRKIHTIIDNLSIGVISLNSQHQITLINPAAVKMMDINPEQILLKKYWQMLKFPRFHSLVNLLSIHKWSNFSNVEILTDQNFYLSVSLKRIKINQHRNSYLVTLEDITRQKNLEKVKSDFISLSAHQLRTPLSAMKWSLYLLRQEKLSSKERKNLVEQLYLTNERMIKLINDFLEAAKIEEGKIISNLSLVNIKSLIKFTINLYQKEIEKKKIRIDFEVRNKIRTIEADPGKLAIAFRNLIDNAIDYTPPKRKIKIILESKKKKVLIRFINDSQEILPSEEARIFSKFFRGQNAIKIETVGSGLGLFIAKNIIEAHQGEILFDFNRRNKKTTFLISLPTKLS